MPDEGTVRTRGKVSALLELGAGFHPELSGRENVYLNGSILGLSKAELDRRFDDIVAFAGLERFIDTPVKNYSSGMYVRLGFSVAINVDPDILLVDEVLAVGDEQFQRRCNERFADLRARGHDDRGRVALAGLGAGDVRRGGLARPDGVLRAIGPAGDVVDQYLAEVHEDRSAEEPRHRVPAGAPARFGWSGSRCSTAKAGPPTTSAPAKRSPSGFHYDAAEPIERPTFSVELHTLEGVLLTNPNAREAGLTPDQHRRAGGPSTSSSTGCRCSPAPTTCRRPSRTRRRCTSTTHRHRALRFDVEPGDPRESFGGVLTLQGRWQHELDVSSPLLDGC